MPVVRNTLRCILLLAALCLTAGTAHGQGAGSTGIGAQIGDPSGITLKLYQRPTFAYDLVAAWDFDDYLMAQGHAVYEHRLQDGPLNYFLGPGAFIRVDSGAEGKDDVRLGASGNFGINFFVEKFEVYLQVTPRLSIIPDTDGQIGGGVGLRYYF